MKTLYFRVVIISLLIVIMSLGLAFLASNIYYQAHIKTYYEEKVMSIAQEVKSLVETAPNGGSDTYLNHISGMGFQLALVNEQYVATFYGRAFKYLDLEDTFKKQVLEIKQPYSILEQPKDFFFTSFFKNSLSNSVGIPLQIEGKPYALFVRPDLEQQIGEVRYLMATLLSFTFFFSMIFVIIFTRYIVRPVKSLTNATKQIMEGNYELKLDVTRKDEIGNLASHFSSMAQSLKQLDDMRQEFVGNVSHEIQSPLASIQGFVSEAMNKDTSPEERMRYLTIIDNESRRLSSLSKQLLTLASLDKESNMLKKSIYRLDEQLREIIIMTEWQWTEKQIEINLDSSAIHVNADKQLMHLVWLNLMTNSIKFSNVGSTIQIHIELVHNVVKVQIADSGIGIPEEDLPSIFERFYKVDRARNRSQGGSGLGLSIVQKIIHLHQGTIEAKSEVGQGTTIIVRLP
ncbi:HAMP domain-containing histidine kinase [Paenibacillus sp. N1-5-1-14]|uniref:sensor histidine kinase n=1 Tax=Paenibacillus radicibacter TaxID=2972488 RepID=UPI002158E87B|nr:HAMP domain-containing sensor histidine kinase [Paenibacillus radicibacter]MCR8645168.1 HAMP domain-containing histidine kinase [Paenibacillus radicibacter]